MITKEQAVMSLRPGVEWTMTENDVESIVWHTENVEPLTPAEVDAEMARLETEAINAEGARVKGIQDAQDELKALGLSDSAVATISGHPYPYATE